MTSGCQPNQVHSAIVKRSIPVRIIPDVVSSSPSEAVAYSMPSTVWDVRLQELTIYRKQNNGKTNVPQHHPPNQPLANWVNTQRQQYKLLKEGKNSHMTKERIKYLNKLDFEWVVSSASWERHLQELVTYKEQNNGSTNVSQRCLSNKPLGIWVQKQRHQYKLLKDLKKSSMTTVRIKSLNELDFEWNPILHNRK
jgi:hypothetical protein